MWIKIKKQLINLNHIQTIRWDETDNDVFLYLYPPSNISAGNGRLDFQWKIRNDDGTKNHDGIARLTNVAKRVAKATNTIIKIFECELADNSDDVIVQAVRDVGQRGEFIGE